MSHKPFARVFAVVLGFALAAGSVRAEIIEQVLVKVNGEILTKTDLETRQAAQLREQGQRIDLKSDAGNLQLKKLLDEVTPQILVDAVNEMLVVQRGKELGYKLTDDQFKSVVDNIRKENKLDTDEQFQAALKQENMTMVDLRRNLERRMIFERVQQNEVMSKIALTDDEARAYYDSHLQEFTTPPSITLREVLVATPADARGANVAGDEAAKVKADQIRARAKGGESFETLVAEASEAPSRSNGGLIGPISVNDLSPDLRKLIDTMKVGDVTEPLRTARGYQILKLESSTPNNILPFEQAKDRIGERVFTDKRRIEFDKYLTKLRTEAIIEWKNPDIHKAFDEGIKQAATSVGAPTASAAPASR